MPRIPKVLAAFGNPKLAGVKDKALLIWANALFKELTRRTRDGSFAKELKDMDLGKVLWQLQKLAEVTRGPMQIGVNVGTLPAPASPQLLHQGSSLKKTPHSRLLARAQARKELIHNAEVVKEPIPTEPPEEHEPT